MKHKTSSCVINIFFILTIFLPGCAFNHIRADLTKIRSKTSTEPNQSNDSASPTGRIFTLAELATYDGQNGKPAYIAVDGIVYDVTDLRGWRKGEHQGNHKAGRDLTKELSNSPHGGIVIENLPVIGKL